MIELDYIHKKQTGGAGQFARVKLSFEVMPAGSGFSFINSIPPDRLNTDHLKGCYLHGFVSYVEKGVKEAASGIRDDLRVEISDFSYHDIDSSVLSFQIAGMKAFEEAIDKGL